MAEIGDVYTLACFVSAYKIVIIFRRTHYPDHLVPIQYSVNVKQGSGNILW